MLHVGQTALRSIGTMGRRAHASAWMDIRHQQIMGLIALQPCQVCTTFNSMNGNLFIFLSHCWVTMHDSS